MRIAIFTDEFLPQINGVVTYILDTAEELIKRGNEVLIFAPKPRRGYKLNLSKFPFKVILLSSLPALLYPDFRLTVPALPRVLLQLRKFKPDVIHIMDPLTMGTDGIMAAKIRKIPIIITFHTFFMDEDMLSYFKLKKRARLLQTPLWKLTSFYHNLANTVICPSLVSQRELEKHGLKKPAIVVSNGIDLTKTKKLTTKEIEVKRQIYGIKSTERIAIYVGRLAPDKSLDVLLSAWKMVVQKEKDAKLILVGSGPEERKLKELVNDLDLNYKVVFWGSIAREKILTEGIYCLADIFVTASKIENQSLAMLEAMAHSLPLVGVRARGTPELIDETNGLIVEPDKPNDLAQAIIKLLADKKLREKLAKGSWKKVQEFDLKKSVSKLEAVYRVLAHFKTL